MHASPRPRGYFAEMGLPIRSGGRYSGYGTKMANTPSAKKAVRKITRRTAINRSRRSKMRTYVRKVEEAVAAGDSAAALEALRFAEPIMMRAAQNGIVHKNTASRKVSRLTKRVQAMAQ